MFTGFSARERLALCMIVKNEAATLGRCLEAAAPWVSEVVIVDTGSSDDSPLIAAGFGARVLKHPWNDDFAEARNIGLEAATRPWVLVLDADETLEIHDSAEFAAALTQEQTEAFRIICRDQMPFGESVGRVLRLFRRDRPGMRFRGALHEQVAAASDGLVTIAELPAVQFRHDGYRPEIVLAKGKVARNVAIARAMTERSPEDGFAWYCLGNALGPADATESRQAYAEAWRLALSLGDDLGLRLAAAYARLLFEQEEPSTAEAVIKRALKAYPLAPDLRYLEGELAIRRHDWQGAIAALEACIRPEARMFPLILDPAATGFGARCRLAEAYAQVGRLGDAEGQLEAALDEPNPDPRPALRLLVSWRRERRDWPGIDALLRTPEAERDPGLSASRADALLRLERFEEAAQILAVHRDEPETRAAQGRLALWAGNLAEAEELLPSGTLERVWIAIARGLEPANELQALSRTSREAASVVTALAHGELPSSWLTAWPLEVEEAPRYWLRSGAIVPLEAALNVLHGAEAGGAVLLQRAWARACALEGQLEVAAQLLACAQLAEPSAEGHYWLGYCALHSGNLEGATIHWRLASDHPSAQAGLALLARLGG